MRSFWIMLAALLQISVAPVGTGSIEGIVVDSAGRPVERAEAEALIALPPQGAYLPPRAITDQNGRFRLIVGAGAWRVRITAPGYARQEYGAAVSGFRGVNTGTVIDLVEGQTVRGLRVRLTGNAIVSGRVTSPNGVAAGRHGDRRTAEDLQRSR